MRRVSRPPLWLCTGGRTGFWPCSPTLLPAGQHGDNSTERNKESRVNTRQDKQKSVLLMSHAARQKRKHKQLSAIVRNHVQLLHAPLVGTIYQKYKTTEPDPYAGMLVEIGDRFSSTNESQSTVHAPFQC